MSSSKYIRAGFGPVWITNFLRFKLNFKDLNFQHWIKKVRLEKKWNAYLSESYFISFLVEQGDFGEKNRLLWSPFIFRKILKYLKKLSYKRTVEVISPRSIISFCFSLNLHWTTTRKLWPFSIWKIKQFKIFLLFLL